MFSVDRGINRKKNGKLLQKIIPIFLCHRQEAPSTVREKFNEMAKSRERWCISLF